MKKLLLLILVIACGFVWYSVSSVGSAPVKKGQYSIEAGSLFSDLNQELKLGVSDWKFRAYRKFYAPDFELKSGTFVVGEDTTFENALESSLKKPAYTDLTFTILPGWSKFDIDPYLAEKKFIKAGDLISATPSQFPKLVQKYAFLKGMDSFEGVMYPDTYRIRQEADLEEFLDTLLGVFQTRIYAKLDATQKTRFMDTLILASIVEREERNSDEKAKVAGVLAKRLDIRMSLGADATLCYALSLGFRDCTPARIVAGLDSTSKYNTRKYAGLPPTPIANPSRETWLAALYPVKTDNLYYLHDPDGAIHYGRTNEEHNANKRKYLQ